MSCPKTKAQKSPTAHVAHSLSGPRRHYSAVAWRWRGGAGRSLDGAAAAAAAAAAAKAAAQVDTLTPLASWASFDFDVTIQLRGKERRVRWVGGRTTVPIDSAAPKPKSRFTRRRRRPASPLKAVAKAECRGRGGAADRPSEESGVVASPHRLNDCLLACLSARLPVCLPA